MIASMTGFGKSQGVFEGNKCTIEIRSLNSKGLDLNLRFPPFYKDLEVTFRKTIGEQLDRGKIDVNIYKENTGENSAVNINRILANQYYDLFNGLAKEWGEKSHGLMELVLKMPEVISNNNDALSETEIKFIESLFIDACSQVNEFRYQEGEVLKTDILYSIGQIRTLLKNVEPFESERILAVRERLEKTLQAIGGQNIDQNRLEQELLFYLDKLDISEEKTRLSAHLSYFEETISLPRTGKKLGFIIQEIGREINTLGSKSNHAEMQKIVVDMKNHLEKIKEQTLNVL